MCNAFPAPDFQRFTDWRLAGMAGAMGYLTDHRADLREDARSLLPSARSVIVVGKLYRGPEPYSTEFSEPDRAWISRYAWGDDYHELMRRGLEALRDRLSEVSGPFESRVCVDTAPILERSYARAAGLGWIGKNTCLINQRLGSWFFLGELLVSLDLPADSPPPDRCGTCTRCIDACPTTAIVPHEGGWRLDARRCISYHTIELRGEIPEEFRSGAGNHIFGCDICQDVCPWNRRSPHNTLPEFRPRVFAPALDRMAALTEEQFRELFRGSAIRRTKYAGFLRNVATAMGNSGNLQFVGSLQFLARSGYPEVAGHAKWALDQLGAGRESPARA